MADWSWTMTDGGLFVAAMCIVPDGQRRGWFVAYPSERMTAARLRPMFRRFDVLRQCDIFDTLLAWVKADDVKPRRFAEWFGFRPCREFDETPLGTRMELYMWRRD